MHIYPDAPTVARAFAPDQPVILNRPHAAARAARFFAEKFPGKSMYAVKANPSPDLLQVLWDAGITHFDVASIAEVRLVRSLLPEATLCFMHPVKTEERDRRGLSRRTACARSASTPTRSWRRSSRPRERHAEDLNLLVRLRVSSEYAEYSLASKFGIDLADAAPLLQATRQHCDALGICFHVGSQAMTPVRLRPGARARPRGDRRGGGDGRHRRRRRRLPEHLPGHGAAAAGGLLRPHRTAISKRCRSRTPPSCGASPAARCAPSIRA